MDSIPDPTDVIAAVVHPNPYPSYAALVADSPLYYDPTQRRWIALGAAVVRSVLHSQDCRVRPADEPVPRSLLGSGAAAIFGALIRMNDGHAHYPFKRVVATALDAVADQPVLAQSQHWATVLFGDPPRQSPHSAISAYAFHLPVYVVASLLGVAPAMVPQVACWMQDLVPCFGPASSVDQIPGGKSSGRSRACLLSGAHEGRFIPTQPVPFGDA